MVIRRAVLFRDLVPAEVQAVVRAASRVRANRGVPVFRQGDPATKTYVLVRGKIKLTLFHPEGQAVIVSVIGPGDAFGAVAALGGTHYPVSAESAEAVEALAWDGPTMERLFKRYPTLAVNALRVLAGRVQELQTRLSGQVADRVEQRLAQAILRLVGHAGRKVDGGVLLDMPLSRQDVAELAGTTLYTASRIMSRWQSQGLITAGRQWLLVRDPHGLVAATERTLADGRRRQAPTRSSFRG